MQHARTGAGGFVGGGGRRFLSSARSYDLVLCVALENREALESYQSNEFHCRSVKPVMHELTEKSVSVDFECGEF